MIPKHSNYLLRVEHLHMQFGGLIAINNLSFMTYPNDITSIIGPNGAGKTTLFNCLTSFYKPTSGRLTLRNKIGEKLYLERLEGFQISQRAKMARTFQNIRLFPQMTVLENLMIAQHATLIKQSGYNIFGLLGLKRYHNTMKKAVDKACYWLEHVQLLDHADQLACNLSYGAQRRLEIARAMCTDPIMLCLDEPAAGLNPQESDELNQLLLFIRDQYQIGILLVEHDMSVVMKISDHIIVLDHGQKIADGTPREIQNNQKVIEAYLGVDTEDEAS